MSEWVIVSESDPSFSVRVGESSREHAESVLWNLCNPGFIGPRDLVLLEEGTRRPEPVAVEEKPKRRFWRR